MMTVDPSAYKAGSDRNTNTVTSTFLMSASRLTAIAIEVSICQLFETSRILWGLASSSLVDYVS
jgi:hypothetical protein